MIAGSSESTAIVHHLHQVADSTRQAYIASKYCLNSKVWKKSPATVSEWAISTLAVHPLQQSPVKQVASSMCREAKHEQRPQQQQLLENLQKEKSHFRSLVIYCCFKILKIIFYIEKTTSNLWHYAMTSLHLYLPS